MGWWVPFISGAGVAVVLVQVLIKSGIWIGHHDDDSARLAGLRADCLVWIAGLKTDIIERLADLKGEIKSLRDWRHEVGDQPGWEAGETCKLLESKIEMYNHFLTGRLETLEATARDEGRTGQKP